MNFSNFFNLNFFLIFILILLCFIGVAAQFSAAEGNFEPWAIKHAIRFAVLLVAMLIIALIDIKIIYKYAYYIFVITLCLLFSDL